MANALASFNGAIHVCVVGESGGIGRALVDALVADPNVACIFAGSRRSPIAREKVIPFEIDLEDEASIEKAAQHIKPHGALHLILIATGVLHLGEYLAPEKSYKGQTERAYAKAFAINTIGPALVGKHFLPLLTREGKSVFAAISARVSSISDNRLGGWHAYRASKAALNMVVQNFALEIARTHQEAIAVTLHPGTVDTDLSKPFQRGVAPEKLFSTDQSAEYLLKVIDKLTPSDSGGLFAWDGERIAF